MKDEIKSNFDNFVNDWIHYLNNTQGYSKHTYTSYERDVLDFYEFCNKNKIIIFKTDKYLLRDYLFELNERQVSRATVARRISSLKNFFKYALKQKK